MPAPNGVQYAVAVIISQVDIIGPIAVKVLEHEPVLTRRKQKGKGATGKRLGTALMRLAEKDRESRVEGEQGQEQGNGAQGVHEDGVASTAGIAPSDRTSKRKKRNGSKKAASGTASEDYEEVRDEEELYTESRKRARRARKAKA